ncbi:MAG: acyclic terpene utilization AtuA family protein, partial [Lentisphaeria bacterium]|nr:acyclic terpene utilization AtuA family protein [Lentisphaeria bacterium]
MPTDELTYLSLCGMLGYGYPEENLQRAMQANPAFIAADNGSTDPGPYYLGSGTGFVRPEQIRRDLELALVAARQANIPLIIGSAGGAGAAPHLAAFRKILLEIAQCHGLRFRLATIPADVDKADVLQALDAGRISPCGPVPPLTAERVRSCSHLVGQMGTGPIIQALRGGADVVVVGRCCDTAIFAALPMMRGFDPALAMHSAKIAECGTLCATPGGANDSLLITLRRDSFTVRPVAPEKRCLPRTVAAHSLYEQPSPHEFIEPEGTVDLRDATFTAEDKRSVRVSGTRLIPPDVHTVKLEGATRVGYRSITLAGTRDPGVIANLDTIEQAVR